MSRQQPPSADADLQDGNAAFGGAAARTPPGGSGPGGTTGQPERTAPGRAGRRRPDPWRTAFFGVLVLAIAAGAAWALLGSSLLVVRQVDVTGNRLVSAVRIRTAAAIRKGQPLATVNTTAAAARVERIGPVLSALVTRSWPDTIVITVVERTPALAVAAAGGYQLVDEYGVTVRTAARDPAGMPLLTSPPAVLRGSPAVRAAVLVLHQLPRGLRLQVSSVSAAAASAVILRLKDGTTVMWGGPGQPARKAAELALLMGTHARYFDVSDPSSVVTGR